VQLKRNGNPVEQSTYCEPLTFYQKSYKVLMYSLSITHGGFNMGTKGSFTVLCLLVASVLITGCGSAENNAMKAMPLMPQLYLTTEDRLLPKPDYSTFGSTRSYPDGGSASLEWGMPLSGEAIGNDYSYKIVMASTGRSTATVEIILMQGSQATELGKDTVVINSTQYKPYRGQFSGANPVPTSSDRVILRITVSGDDFGIKYGGTSSSIGLLAAPEITSAVANERAKALVWVAGNTVCNDKEPTTCDLFNNFKDLLDLAIIEGDNVKWGIGWGLTVSGEPNFLEWVNESFNVEEISIEVAQEAGIDEGQMTVEFNP